MVTKRKIIRETRDKQIADIVALSTDTKPINGIANGSMLLEMDTGKFYVYNETGTAWVELS